MGTTFSKRLASQALASRRFTSQRFGAFVLGAALAASGVLAQTGGDTPPEIQVRHAGQIAASSQPDAPPPPEARPGSGPTVVSVDVLRHRIAPRVEKMILRALEKMDAGDHETAIGQLLETLTKYPESAPYVHNLLGVEYVKTDRFQAAVSSFERAVALLPHDAMTHYNFGLALICTGDYDRAAQEIQRALELDPKNTRMQARLDALLEHRRSGN
jgi:tetratricopeptide (TPR) repeat protein